MLIMHLLIDKCGLLVIFNPLNHPLIDQYLDIDLYYTGAKNKIYITYQEERPFKSITLTDQYHYSLNFNISARIFNCNQTLPNILQISYFVCLQSKKQ